MNPGPATTAARPKAILDAIVGEIEPVRSSPVYVLGLALVAVAMVLLPLIYLGLIAAVAYGVYWYFTNGIALIGRVRGRGAILVYLGPPAIGLMLLFFMIKPLFAPRGRQQQPRLLKREDEPLLFAFVARICQAVHAPAPREICVDCEVNASASFRRGLWSMLGNDLSLTIGLPLAAGLTLRQLAGVLAHEFGHFSQGLGMRLTYVIRMISFWFVRVVYERDGWDEKLETSARTNEGWIWLLVQLTRFFVWMARRVLWVLMWIGHVISGFMLRQMEFDADRHEARLAGSEVFAATSKRIVELSVANQMAMSDLGQFYEEGRLADDLPALVLANIPQITPEIRRNFIDSQFEARTGLFDTHPAMADRIASARREAAEGLFVDQGSADSLPATDLFRDFEKVSRAITLGFYREALGRKVKPEELHRVSHLLERQTAEIEARKALGRYFQNACSALRPFPVPDELLAPPESSRATGAALKVARERMLALAPEYRAAFRAYDEADTTYLNAARAAAVHASGAKFDGRKLDIEARSSDEARAAGKEARQAMDDAAPRLAPFEAAASERFWSALRLVHVAKVRERLAGDDGLVKGMSAFASALHLTTRLSSELIRLRDKMIAFAAVCSCIEGNEQRSSLIEALQSRSRELRRMLQELYGQLASAPYPFDSAREGMTLRDHVFPVDDGPPVPESDDIASMLHAARRAYESMLGLHLRLSARLAERAEQIESLLGLPPLPEVPEEPGAEAPSDFAESE